jgi:hypothetical protein
MTEFLVERAKGRRLGAPNPVKPMTFLDQELPGKSLREKQGRPVARSAQMGTANATMRPAMSVPKSFGTGGALAARHVPCLAKTTRVLHVISLVGDP